MKESERNERKRKKTEKGLFRFFFIKKLKTAIKLLFCLNCCINYLLH